jgi:hypothetical protein
MYTRRLKVRDQLLVKLLLAGTRSPMVEGVVFRTTSSLQKISFLQAARMATLRSG